MQGQTGILITAALALGCGGKKPTPSTARDAGPAAPIDAGPVVDAAPIDAIAAAPRPAAADEVAAARVFVERWLGTQNDGDFTAYQALYADPMRGVRRSGSQVRRFDRAGWMRDRKAMFRKPMTVTAEDVVVYAAGPLRQVFFTQTWEQGSYRDVGTKNLVLTGAGDDTRILYEELLGSRILATASAAPRTGAGADWYGYDHAATLTAMRLAPVMHGQVLVAATDRAIVPRGLTVLEALRDPADGTYRAGVVNGELAVDDPLAAVAGQAVIVLDAQLRERCRGVLGRPRVEVAGYLADGVDDEDAIGPALWARERAVVTAPVAAPCPGDFVAAVDAPAVTAVADVDQLTAAAARAVLAGLAEDGVTVEWSAAIDDGARGFALVNRDRPETCEAPELHERVLFSAQANGGRWRLTEVARLDGPDRRLWVGDVDGDGQLDAVVGGGLYRAGAFELWRPVLHIPWPAGLGCDGYDGSD